MNSIPVDHKPAIVIDVRTPAEFSQGNIIGSINIPLQDLPAQIESIKKQASSGLTIFVCCASGGRSALATQILHNAGVSDVQDGGSWQDLGAICHL